MNKINFKDLPDTTTPINASNLNQLQTNIDNDKVSKSGSTLTGELIFNNNTNYTTLKKYRTISNDTYFMTVGVGGNKSARMEFGKTVNDVDNVLSSVETRENGSIYNGKTGKKLVEEDEIQIQTMNIEDFISMQTGFSYATNMSFLYKQGKHIWGNIVIQKDTGYFTSTQDDVAHLKVNINNSKTTNTYCALSYSLWRSTGIGYVFIGSSIGQQLYIADHNADNYNIAKIKIDCVLT